MYDELVKRLREHGEFLIVSDRMKAPPNVNVRNLFAEDYAQAADAIEQLIEERDAYRKAMTDEHNRAATLAWEKEHCWIPVTEENDGEV